MRNFFIETFLIIVLCFVAVRTLEAATLEVAAGGLDDSSCGDKNTPCRSISQAIANASAGDRIVVGPGSYGPTIEGVEGPAGCLCMIHVYKSLTIESRDGAEVTLLDVGGADAFGVLVEANQVVFGKMNKGFTIANSRRQGLILGGSTSNVDIQSNVATGNGSNGNDAFQIQGTNHKIIGNARGGFGISGKNHTVTGNVSTGNLLGIDAFFSGGLTHNAIIGNRLDGLTIGAQGLGLRVSQNDVIGNGQRGIVIRSQSRITNTNIFGNVSCGLENTSGGLVDASHNFWGASSGPGPDPADQICNDLQSTTNIDPVATKEFNIQVLAEN